MNLFRKSCGEDRPVGMMAAAVALMVAVCADSASFGQQRSAPDKLQEGASCVSKECHGKLASGKTIHRPVAKKTCAVCHEQDEETEHKFAYPDSGSELCYGCHESVTKGKHVHAPLKDKKRPCITCHNPHASEGKHLLRAKTTTAQCLKCHDHFKPKLSAMSKRHSKLLEKPDCLRCHQAHGGARKSLLLKAPKDLCLTCHDKDVKSGGGHTVKGLADELAKGAKLHGPVASGNCGRCHEPHGNAKSAFLRKDYPRKFYSPYTPAGYALCFSCHEASLAADKHTGDATGFRDGNVNLHYVHVNKPRKGRTCRACHVAHGAKNKHMLAETVRFGQWKIPIRFRATKDGGTCAAGCHASKTYSRTRRATPKTKPAKK